MDPLAMTLIIADNDCGRHQHEKQLRPPGRSHRHRPPVFASPEASYIPRRLLILPGHRGTPSLKSKHRWKSTVATRGSFFKENSRIFRWICDTAKMATVCVHCRITWLKIDVCCFSNVFANWCSWANGFDKGFDLGEVWFRRLFGINGITIIFDIDISIRG